MVKLRETLTPDTIRKTDGKQKHGFGKRRKTENGTAKTGKYLNGW